MNKRSTAAILCCAMAIGGSSLHAEDFYHTTNYWAETSAEFTTGDNLPFLMSANRHGIYSPEGSQGYVRGGIDYRRTREEKKFYYGAGADLIGYLSGHHSYYNHNFYLQQLYAEMGSGQYFVTLGSKQQPARFVNSELSSGNMVWSGNARPIPGIYVGTRDFVKLFIVADLLEASFDLFYGKMLDGDFNNDRFDQYKALGDAGPLRASAFDGAYLHRKSLLLRTPSKQPFFVTIGLEHAAMFGGDIRHIDGTWDPSREEVRYEQSCQWGKALAGGEGDDDDALNHLMTFDARMDFQNKKFGIGLYKQHYADDLNSKSFSNFTDGLWGFELKLKRNTWLKQLVVEFIKTDSQRDNAEALKKIEQGVETSEEDFASDFYQDQRFGAYAYYGMMCGNPMVASPIYNSNGYTGLLYNNIQGFHVGAEGEITQALSYRLKFCTISSKGDPWTAGLEKLAGKEVCSYTDTSMLLELNYNRGNWNFASHLAFDSGTLFGDSFGAGLSVRYSGQLLKTVWK